MGIFDKLVGNKVSSITPQTGLLLAAITMIAIDGDVDDDELAILRRLDRDSSSGAFEKAFKVWKSQTIEECVRLVVSATNTEQQQTIIANLIDIAMADGVLLGKEKNLLEKYVSSFTVNSSVIEKIIEVVSIKNNSSIF